MNVKGMLAFAKSASANTPKETLYVYRAPFGTLGFGNEKWPAHMKGGLEILYRVRNGKVIPLEC